MRARKAEYQKIVGENKKLIKDSRKFNEVKEEKNHQNELNAYENKCCEK